MPWGELVERGQQEVDRLRAAYEVRLHNWVKRKLCLHLGKIAVRARVKFGDDKIPRFAEQIGLAEKVVRVSMEEYMECIWAGKRA